MTFVRHLCAPSRTRAIPLRLVHPSGSSAISAPGPTLPQKNCSLFSCSYAPFHFPYTRFFPPSSLLSIPSALFPKNTGVCTNSSQNGTHRPGLDRRSEEHTSELQSRLHLVC